MDSLYNLPNGDQLHVADPDTVAAALHGILQRFREGATEPVFVGDSRPDGVLISFDQWSEYETLRQDAEDDKRREQLVRERLANAKPEDYVPFEDMVKEYGWEDPDENPGGK